MTAFVSPERATAASLTGAIGLLILAIAVVMMVMAAPTQVHYGALTQRSRPPCSSRRMFATSPRRVIDGIRMPDRALGEGAR